MAGESPAKDDDDDFAQVYSAEYVRPGSKPSTEPAKTDKGRKDVAEPDDGREDPNEVPTDFVSKYSKIWDARAKAAERNWKRRREDDLTCRICGEVGHPTQACPSTLGASRKERSPEKPQPSVSIKVGDRRLRSRVIGSAGVVVQGLEKQTKCRIRVEDDTEAGNGAFVIKLTANDEAKVAKGEKIVRDYVLSLQEESKRPRTAPKATTPLAAAAAAGTSAVGGLNQQVASAYPHGTVAATAPQSYFVTATGAPGAAYDAVSRVSPTGVYQVQFETTGYGGGVGYAQYSVAAVQEAAVAGGGGGDAGVGAGGGTGVAGSEEDAALRAIAAQLEAGRQRADLEQQQQQPQGGASFGIAQYHGEPTSTGVASAAPVSEFTLPEGEEELENACAAEIRALLAAQRAEEEEERQRHEIAMSAMRGRHEEGLVEARGRHERARARFQEREEERARKEAEEMERRRREEEQQEEERRREEARREEEKREEERQRQEEQRRREEEEARRRQEEESRLRYGSVSYAGGYPGMSASAQQHLQGPPQGYASSALQYGQGPLGLQSALALQQQQPALQQQQLQQGLYQEGTFTPQFPQQHRHSPLQQQQQQQHYQQHQQGQYYSGMGAANGLQPATSAGWAPAATHAAGLLASQAAGAQGSGAAAPAGVGAAYSGAAAFSAPPVSGYASAPLPAHQAQAFGAQAFGVQPVVGGPGQGADYGAGGGQHGMYQTGAAGGYPYHQRY